MGTAQSFPSPPAEPVDLTAASAESGGSFWTGAPKLLAAFATILGSIVALTTVLVQAGVIGSASAGQTTATLPVQPALGADGDGADGDGADDAERPAAPP